MFLEFALGSEDIPRRVELLFLRVYGLSLLRILCLQVLFLGCQSRDVGVQLLHIAVEVADSLVELADVYVLCAKLSPEFLQLAVFFGQLACHAVDGALQLVALEARLAQLLAQLLEQLAVLLHARSNELDVALDALGLVGTLGLLGHRYAVLGLIDGSESVLYSVQCAEHIVDLVVAGIDDGTQRVVLYHRRVELLLVFGTGHECQKAQAQCNISHINQLFLVFPCSTITISPFGGVLVKWAITSARVPRTLSSCILDISRHTLTSLSCPITSANWVRVLSKR